MKRKINKTLFLIIVVYFFVEISDCLAQIDTSSQLPDLIPYRKGNKWGYCNPERQLLINCKYDFVDFFYEDIALVKLVDKYGFINKNGKEIAPIKYDIVKNFNEGIAIVCLNNKYGLINKEGKEITPIKYDIIDDFYNGVAKVILNGRCGLINKEGRNVSAIKYKSIMDSKIDIFYNRTYQPIPSKTKDWYFFPGKYLIREGLFKVELNNKFGYINKDGKEVTLIKYDYIDNMFGPGTGVTPVKINNKWGFLNRDGKEITPLIYDKIVGWAYSFYIVELSGKLGIINEEGKEITAFKYDDYIKFFEGFVVVKLNNKVGLIDNEGNEIIPIKYDNISSIEDNSVSIFANGVARIELNNKYGLINKEGEEITPIKYDIINNFSEGLAGVSLNEKCGFINTEGKEIIPLIYDDLTIWGSGFKEGVAKVRLKEKCILINSVGKEIFKYKSITNDFKQNGYASAILNKKWGIINKEEKIIIPFVYDCIDHYDIDDSQTGFAMVTFSGKHGYVFFNDKNNIFYDEITKINDYLTFVRLNNKYALFDRNGNKLTPFIFDKLCPLNIKNNLIYVEIGKNMGFINQDGKEVIPIKYELLDYYGGFQFRNNLLEIRINEKRGYIDLQGTEYWEE